MCAQHVSVDMKYVAARVSFAEFKISAPNAEACAAGVHRRADIYAIRNNAITVKDERHLRSLHRAQRDS